MAVAILVSLLGISRVIEPLERRGFDERLSLRVDHGWPPDLVVIPIDDAAQRLVGRWPWPRDITARLIRELRALGAKTIVLDGLLAAPTDPKADADIEEALAGVVMGIGYSPKALESTTPADIAPWMLPAEADPAAAIGLAQVVAPLSRFAARASIGHPLWWPQADGVVRGFVPLLKIALPPPVGETRLSYLPGSLPAVGLLGLCRQRGLDLSRVELKGSLSLPGGPPLPVYDGETYLDMVPGGSGPASIRAIDLLQHTDDPAARKALTGRLALIYVDSAEYPDRLETPLSHDTPGGMLLAYSIRTLDSGHLPRPVPYSWAYLLAGLPFLLFARPLSRRGPGLSLILAGLSAAAVIGIGVALVPAFDLFAPIAGPAMELLLAGGLLAAYAGRMVEQDRRRLRTLLEASAVAQGMTPSSGAVERPAVMAGDPDARVTVPSSVEPASLSGLLTGGQALAKPVQLGRYQILRAVGKGGMGAIFLAMDQDLERPVAIKVLDAQSREAYTRFRREALAVARITHPNVVAVYEIGFDAQVPYIVMEYVAGGTVAEAARRAGGTLPWPKATRIISGVAEGLGAVHAKGIVHRDIKPSNLLLMDKDGDVAKVADFGIAKLGNTEAITRAGSFVGTIGYLSPEQATGQALDPRSDVYSLGVTWYRILTGALPYEGSTAEVLTQTVTKRLPDPRTLVPDLPGPLVELMSRMCALDPRARPRDGKMVAQALSLALPGFTSASDPVHIARPQS